MKTKGMKITHAIIKDGINFGIPEGTKVPEKKDFTHEDQGAGLFIFHAEEYNAAIQALLSISIQFEEGETEKYVMASLPPDAVKLSGNEFEFIDGIYPLEGVEAIKVRQRRSTNNDPKWSNEWNEVHAGHTHHPRFEYRTVLRLIPQHNSEQKKDLCHDCNGSGTVGVGINDICDSCKGTGVEVTEVSEPTNPFGKYNIPKDPNESATYVTKVGVDEKKEPETTFVKNHRNDFLDIEEWSFDGKSYFVGSLKDCRIYVEAPNYEQCLVELLKSSSVQIQNSNKRGVSEEEPTQLSTYLKREAKGHTEFRLVVLENGTAYIHVLGRDSETLNFSI